MRDNLQAKCEFFKDSIIQLLPEIRKDILQGRVETISENNTEGGVVSFEEAGIETKVDLLAEDIFGDRYKILCENYHQKKSKKINHINLTEVFSEDTILFVVNGLCGTENCSMGRECAFNVALFFASKGEAPKPIMVIIYKYLNNMIYIISQKEAIFGQIVKSQIPLDQRCHGPKPAIILKREFIIEDPEIITIKKNLHSRRVIIIETPSLRDSTYYEEQIVQIRKTIDKIFSSEQSGGKKYRFRVFIRRSNSIALIDAITGQNDLTIIQGRNCDYPSLIAAFNLLQSHIESYQKDDHIPLNERIILIELGKKFYRSSGETEKKILLVRRKYWELPEISPLKKHLSFLFD